MDQMTAQEALEEFARFLDDIRARHSSAMSAAELTMPSNPSASMRAILLASEFRKRWESTLGVAMQWAAKHPRLDISALVPLGVAGISREIESQSDLCQARFTKANDAWVDLVHKGESDPGVRIALLVKNSRERRKLVNLLVSELSIAQELSKEPRMPSRAN